MRNEDMEKRIDGIVAVVLIAEKKPGIQHLVSGPLPVRDLPEDRLSVEHMNRPAERGAASGTYLPGDSYPESGEQAGRQAYHSNISIKKARL
jgi:hypothetical protein